MKKKNSSATLIYRSHSLLITLTLLSSVSACYAMDGEYFQEEKYFQEFQGRLQEKYGRDWGVEETTYFHKILPAFYSLQSSPSIEEIPPEPKETLPAFDILSASLDGRSLLEDGGSLLEGFTLNLAQNHQTLYASLSNEQQQGLWKVKLEKQAKKVPYITRAIDANSMIRAIREGYGVEEATYTANISPSDESDLSGLIEIRVQFKKKYPLDVKAMAISYLKKDNKTGVFFDIYDRSNPKQFLDPITPNGENFFPCSFSSQAPVQEKWFKVINNQIYSYSVKKIIYRIFSEEEKNKWLLNGGEGFYRLKLGQPHSLSVPLQYEKLIPDEENSKLIENTKVLPRKDGKALPRKDGKILPKKDDKIDDRIFFKKNSEPNIILSDYLYCDGRGFFTTQHFQEEWSDVDRGEKVEVFYLKHSFSVELLNVKFRGGCGILKQGFYKRFVIGDSRETWQLEDSQTFSFTVDRGSLESTFQTAPKFYPLEQEEHIKTLQKWSPLSFFSLRAVQLTQPKLHLLEESADKLTSLDISSIILNKISWSDVFKGIGFLKSLTELNLSQNSLGDKGILAKGTFFCCGMGTVYDPLSDLHDCLTKLNKLKILKIQGQSFEENSLFKLINSTIKNLKTIEELHIDNIEFREYWLRKQKNNHPQLSESGRTLSQLKDLKFYKNRGKDEVQDALINLGALYYYGQKVPQDYGEAAKWYKLAVNQGHVEAQYKLGVLYDKGQGVQQDYRKAIEWYELAAAQKHAGAQYSLGNLYYDGQRVQQDYGKAIKWYKLAANRGHVEAQYKLGVLYDKSPSEAMEWYAKAANQGHVEAQYNLGILYDKPQSHVEAKEWYAKAANQGHVEAQYKLGVLYDKWQSYTETEKWYAKAANQGHVEAQYKLGVLYDKWQSYTEAEKWYAKAANQGHKEAKNNLKEAQYKLGVLYDKGRGDKQDYGKAIEWYAKAAAQTHADAQYSLGNLHYYGRGVQQDYKKAIEWYKEAAAQAHAGARYSLGNLHYYGRGVQQDYGKAIEWYKEAAAQAHADAQYSLGNLHYYGQGVQQDYGKAIEWYAKAANQGHVDAQYSLGNLYYYGRGGPRNYPEAIRLYELASRKSWLNYGGYQLAKTSHRIWG